MFAGIDSSNIVQVVLGMDFAATFTDAGYPPSSVCPGTHFNYVITSGTIGSLYDRHLRYSWTADPAYVMPAAGGPVGETMYSGPDPYFQATIPFTVYNATNAPVTTAITIIPGVYDNAGPPPSGFVCNLTPQTFTVTIDPFKIVCPSNIGPVNNSADQCYATVATPNPTFLGSCGASSIAWQLTGATTGSGTNYLGPTNFNIGVTTVTYTATNNYGVLTTCSFTVTVTDSQHPAITCPGDISQQATSGLCSAIVNFTPPDGTDNCPGAVTTQIAGLPSGSDFPVGTTVNTFQVRDAVGNTANCSFNITITDNQAPIFSSCPADIPRTTDPGLCSSTFDPPDPVVTDNCMSLVQLTWSLSGATNGSSPSAGINYLGLTAFNQGTTTVTYTATDTGGNNVFCSFNILVTDNQQPTITCPIGISHGVDAGLCSYTYTPNSPGYFDNCSIANLTWTMSGATIGASPGNGINLIPSTAFNTGTTTVTYTVTDGSSLSRSCQFTVIVVDNIPPTLSCPATPQNRSADLGACTYTTVGTEFDPSASDNCSGYILENNLNFANTLQGYVFQLGTTSVTWRIRDGANIVRTCNFTVTVVDTQFPVINCPAPVSPSCPWDIPGRATNYSQFISQGGTASDNCSLANVGWFSDIISNQTCPGRYTITRTYRARNPAGNESRCTQIITVDDQTPPSISPGIPVTTVEGCSASDAPSPVTTVTALESLGLSIYDCWTADAAITVTSSDSSAENCPIVVYRTYRVMDACGNYNTYRQRIQVDDNTAPVISGSIPVSTVEGCSVSAAPAPLTSVGALQALGLTISDACTADADLQVTSRDTYAGTCPIILTRTYTIRDACLNFSTYLQTINVDPLRLLL